MCCVYLWSVCVCLSAPAKYQHMFEFTCEVICIYSRVCCNKQSYNYWMLQRTVPTPNKIRMLQRTEMQQRTRRNTVGRSTRVCMACRAFSLWLERQSASLLSFVRFNCQFSSVICLFAPLAVIFLKLFCYITLAMSFHSAEFVYALQIYMYTVYS